MTRGGITVRVLIYRVRTVDARWTLEVEDRLGSSTCWEETFATAQEASNVFEQHVRVDGIRLFKQPETRY